MVTTKQKPIVNTKYKEKRLKTYQYRKSLNNNGREQERKK